jgi:hypothetical protein
MMCRRGGERRGKRRIRHRKKIYIGPYCSIRTIDRFED